MLQVIGRMLQVIGSRCELFVILRTAVLSGLFSSM